jgi:hypothetical protein
MKKLLLTTLGMGMSLAGNAQVIVNLDGGIYTATTLISGAGNFTSADFDRDGNFDDSGKARTFAGSVTGSSIVMDGRGNVANLDSTTQANWPLFRFLGGEGSDNSIWFRPTSATGASVSKAYSGWASFESSGWSAFTTGTGPSGLSMDVNNLELNSTVRFLVVADPNHYVSATSWTGDVPPPPGALSSLDKIFSRVKVRGLNPFAGWL